MALHSSEFRCTCHDFLHWRDLWLANPKTARQLRDTGHHLRHCTLASIPRRTWSADPLLLVLRPLWSNCMAVKSFTDVEASRIRSSSNDRTQADSSDVLVKMCLSPDARVVSRIGPLLYYPKQCFCGYGIFSKCARCASIHDRGWYHVSRVPRRR